MLILTIIITIHIFVLSILKFFPYPELFVYSFLTKSGLIPYKQIIDQHFPGLMFFPLNLATLGIDTVMEMRIMSYILVLFSHLAIYKISKLLIKDRFILLFPNLLFFIWHPFIEGYVLWIDSFTQVTLLLSLYFLLKNTNRYRFIAGFVFGLTLLLKQTVAPLLLIVLIYLFFTTKIKKDLVTIVIGFLLPMVYLIIWITFNGIWKDFYYWTFIFNITTFAQMGRKMPILSEIVKIIPVIAAPVILVLFPILKQKIDNKMKILVLYFVGALFFAFARFDYVHLQPALPFAILLFIYCISKLISVNVLIKRFYIFYPAFCLILNFFFVKSLIGTNTTFFGEYEKNLTKKVNDLRKEEKVFAFGTTPHIYYLTKSNPPGNVFVFQFPWFMKKAEKLILNGIIADNPAVVIRDSTAEVGGINLVENMPEISAYIDKFYKTIDHLGDTDIMIRI